MTVSHIFHWTTYFAFGKPCMIPHLFLVSSNLPWTCHQMSLAAHCFDLQSFDFCVMHAAENSRGTTTPYYTTDQHSKCFKHHSNHSALVNIDLSYLYLSFTHTDSIWVRHSLSIHLVNWSHSWPKFPPLERWLPQVHRGVRGVRALVAPFGNKNPATKSGKTW